MKYSVWALVFPRNAILQALLNEYMQVSFFNVRKMAAYRLARLPKVHFSTRFAETSAMELRFSNQPERTLSLGFDTCSGSAPRNGARPQSGSIRAHIRPPSKTATRGWPLQKSVAWAYVRTENGFSPSPTRKQAEVSRMRFRAATFCRNHSRKPRTRRHRRPHLLLRRIRPQSRAARPGEHSIGQKPP